MSLKFIKELEAGNFQEVERLLVETPHILSTSRSLMAYGRARKMLLDPETYPGVVEYLTTLGVNPAFANEFSENDQFISLCVVALNLSEANAVYNVPPIFKVLEGMVACSQKIQGVISKTLGSLASFIRQASRDYIKAGYVYLVSQILKHGIKFPVEALDDLMGTIREELKTCGDYPTQLLLVEVLLRIRHIVSSAYDAFSPAVQPHFKSLTKMNFLRSINTLVCIMNDEFRGDSDAFQVRHLLYSGGTISYDDTNISISLAEGIIFCGRTSLCTMLPNIGLIRLPYDILSKMQLSYRKCLLIITFSMAVLSINSPFHVKLREAQQGDFNQTVTIRFSIPDQGAIYAFRDEVGCLVTNSRCLAASAASSAEFSSVTCEQSIEEQFAGVSFCSMEANSQMSQSMLLDDEADRNVSAKAPVKRRSSLFLLFVDRPKKELKLACITPKTPRMDLPERSFCAKTPQIHGNSLDSEDLTHKKMITNINDISISSIGADIDEQKIDEQKIDAQKPGLRSQSKKQQNHTIKSDVLLFSGSTGSIPSKTLVHDVFPPGLKKQLSPQQPAATNSKQPAPIASKKEKEVEKLKLKHAAELVSFKKVHSSKLLTLQKQLLQDKDMIKTLSKEFTAELKLSVELFTDTEQDINNAISAYQQEVAALLQKHQQELSMVGGAADADADADEGKVLSSREAKRAQLQLLRQQRLMRAQP